MIAGGGGIGDSDKSTARTDVIDLTAAKPHFEPGPDLERPVRYPNMVITPDDKVVITGGSTGYRGKGNSNQLLCHIYDPKVNELSRMADPEVGRNYHAEALLLPDGRVITLGSDPLYGDADNHKPGTFEKRIEIYRPTCSRATGRRSRAGRSRSSAATACGSGSPTWAGSGPRGWCARAPSRT